MRLGLLRQDPDGQHYHAGFGLLALARRTWEGVDVRRAAEAEMQRLFEDVQETIHLAVLDGDEIIYIDKLESPQTVRLFSAVGKRGPAYCTGVGKTLLAFLDRAQRERIIAHTDFRAHTENTLVSGTALRQALEEIRVRGCGLDREEHEEGIRGIAAPVFDCRGRVVASLSITSTVGRLPTRRLQDLQPRIIEAARRISRELGRVDDCA
jgi:DNA-binding IclR family transcriptional regulator